MEISGKRKRNDNDDSEEAEIEKFSEIVEKFRAPYDWFSAKMCGSAIDSLRSATNDGDRRRNNKEKIVGGRDSNREDDVWMPCFLLEDFEEEEVIKVWKSKALSKSETAAFTAETIHGGGQEKENDEELDLRLCL